MYDKVIKGKSNLKYADKGKISEQIEMFLDNPEKMRFADSFMNSLWYEYKRIAYKAEAPTEGRTYRNNKIVNMTYEILTHETSADQMLNPGGFEEQKNVGYMIEAYRTTDNSWETLEKTSTGDLKKMVSSDKNLGFFDIHTQFYKQNSTAGTILGMFAVQRIAHAALEGNGYKINVQGLLEGKSITVCGMTFGGYMEFDMQNSRNGQLIGKVLGSLVASAADAVKDPILNLMNINNDTANLLTGLIRLGMPFKDVALLLSQKAVTDIMEELEATAVKGESKTLLSLINSKIKSLEKETRAKDSKLYDEELTKEELIDGLKNYDKRSQLKVLNALKTLSKITNTLKGPSYCTRFNSISNAVGPLAIDNIMMEHKLEDFSEYITDRDGNSIKAVDVFKEHPILNSFAKALDIANDLLNDMPAGSDGFKSLVRSMKTRNIDITKDRKLLSKLSDFYQTYLLYRSGIMDADDADYYINRFAREYIEQDYKNKAEYKDNLLIQSLSLSVDKKHNDNPVLNIDTTGMENTDKERISSGWTDLFKTNRDLAEALIWYNIFRRGIGFSPETFISTMPNYIKERVEGYRETFTNFPSVSPDLVIDQFVRNNASNNTLVPVIPAKDVTLFKGGFEILKDNSGKEPYLKIKEKDSFKLYELVDETVDRERYIYNEISTLGNNGEFMEMSINEIDKAVSENKLIEDSKTGIEEKETEVKEDTLPKETKSERENLQLESLYDLMSELGNISKEEVKSRYLRDKASGKTTSTIYKIQLKNHFKEKLIEKGMEDRVGEIDEYLKLLC